MRKESITPQEKCYRWHGVGGEPANVRCALPGARSQVALTGIYVLPLMKRALPR